MRLLELHIENVRGIADMVLKPGGKTFVVWGANGSGKSAVVDAVDFLLTGTISRLMGKGTAGITLTDHGPHIGHRPQDARVTATIQVPGSTEPVTVSRCMAKPGVLECDKKLTPVLAPMLSVASHGQHVLTRREVLRYVTAEAGARAQQIQELLNVSDVELIRQALVKAHNDADKGVTAARSAVVNAKASVGATAQVTVYNAAEIIGVVNKNRQILGGSPVTDLKIASLKLNLTSPASRTADNALNPVVLERDLQNLTRSVDSTFQQTLAKYDTELRSQLSQLKSDPTLRRILAQAQLVQAGLSLLDETGLCPLCDTAWPPQSLQQHLEHKLQQAQQAQEYKDRVVELSGGVAQILQSVEVSLEKAISASQMLGLHAECEALQAWQARLQQLIRHVGNAIDQYPGNGYTDGEVAMALAPAGVDAVSTRVLDAARAKFPKATPEQTAWDTLTRLEENLKALDNGEHQFERSSLWKTRASLLLEGFQHSRDTVLGDLYESIRDRFVDLYRKLHGEDEAGFTAKLEPDGPSLNFEVDFHGRGTHPPHALHSEGHQDSMGLCLYLSLAERLTKGIVDLIILDDVVMSVDVDHRRQLCSVLATQFPDRQFLITTHDKTWASQLRTEGVVSSTNCTEFFNWDVDTGPQVNHEVELWDRIAEDLKRGDVPGAAHKLRRGSEEYFARVCDALEAPVTYKLSSKWELGELLPAAMKRYKQLLGQAKKAANSWNRTEPLHHLKDLDDRAAEAFKKSQSEQWAVNVNVHYNSWVNFTPKDFAPVVEAFKALYAVFCCSDCGAILRLSKEDQEDTGLRCLCAHENWNLQEKPKAKA